MRINARGLPHSEIPGSKPVCGSPELIAAYHVLHRHLAPRHSPYALSSLTIDMRTNVMVPDSFCVLSSGVNPSFGTLRVCCGRKKLPFAGYSIVKELRRSCDFRAYHLPRHRRSTFARFTSFGGQPSRGLPTVAHARVGNVSEGWRIPGSNR